MGALPCSKKEEDEEDEEEFEGVLDPTKTYWDEYGNLRYGKKRITARTKEKFMREIMEIDAIDNFMEIEDEAVKQAEAKKEQQLKIEKQLKKEKKALERKEAGEEIDSDDDDIDGDDEEPPDPIWYVIDSAWLESWLAHVHLDQDNAPSPGPCLNNRLIAFNPELNQYTTRFGLRMGGVSHKGDYRRITEQCWKAYQKQYPGSGPTITMRYKPGSRNEDDQKGFIDTSKWEIIDPPPPPPELLEKKKKKKVRTCIFGYIPSQTHTF